MTGIIDNFDRLRPALERLARDGQALPIADVRLRAPLPRPGKILALHRELLGARGARGAAAQHVPEERGRGDRAG